MYIHTVDMHMGLHFLVLLQPLMKVEFSSL